jgi:hypothetical protein
MILLLGKQERLIVIILFLFFCIKKQKNVFKKKTNKTFKNELKGFCFYFLLDQRRIAFCILIEAAPHTFQEIQNLDKVLSADSLFAGTNRALSDE